MKIVQEIERVPAVYFKHLSGTTGLYEIRVPFGRDIYWIFSFFDEGNLLVTENGFQKKSQKIPKAEKNKS